MNDLNDKQVGLLMKSALEFNASILVIATSFYGNMESKRNHIKFRAALKNAEKQYIDQFKEILGEGSGLDNK